MAGISVIDARKLTTEFAADNKDVAELMFINADPTGVDIMEITGNGLANYIYRVTSQDGKTSIILKYGEEQLKALPQEKITLERQHFEYEGLKLVHGIEPGSVPEPYCLDRKHNIIAMCDMNGWDLLADQLEAGVVDQRISVCLGHLLAKVHQVTSQEEVSAERWKQLCETFRGGEVKDSTSSFCFEQPYDETGDVFKLSQQARVFFRKYLQVVEKQGFNRKLKTLFYQEMCFIHADLHWKSIFVKDGRAVIFDFEFCFLGHPANNIGYVVISFYIYHLITKNQAHQGEETKDAFRKQFKLAIGEFLNTYMGDMRGPWVDQKCNLLTEVALFTGGLLWASAVYEGFELFTNATDVERLEMLHASFRMMMRHESLTSVDLVVEALFDE